ncbi:Polymerase/histidinol phosphatase-like, partial [Striga hermonthica]
PNQSEPVSSWSGPADRPLVQPIGLLGIGRRRWPGLGMACHCRDLLGITWARTWPFVHAGGHWTQPARRALNISSQSRLRPSSLATRTTFLCHDTSSCSLDEPNKVQYEPQSISPSSKFQGPISASVKTLDTSGADFSINGTNKFIRSLHRTDTPRNGRRKCINNLNLHPGELLDKTALLSNNIPQLLVDWTRGKNLIISSAAPSVTEFRGPQDVANLLSVLGLNREHAKAAISKNCRSLLENALRKKHFYKEAVKVEQVPLGGQQPSMFSDWLKWDPISSGEGDMILDEMEKCFAISCTQMEPVKAINFTCSMNGLPAHGLQIKDLLSVTKPTLDSEPTTMEIEKFASVEKPEDLGGINSLHEEQGSPPENQATVTYSSKEQVAEGKISSSDATDINLPTGCQSLKTFKGYFPEVPTGIRALREEGQTSFGYEAFGTEGFVVPALPTRNGACSNPLETIPIPSENVTYLNDLKTNLVSSEIHSPSALFARNSLHDGGEDTVIAQKIVTDGSILDEISSSLDVNKFPDLILEESNVENCCGVGLCEGEVVPADLGATEVGRLNIEVLSSDVPAQGNYLEGGKNSENNHFTVELSDGFPTEGHINLEANVNDPIHNLVVEERTQLDSVTNYYRGLIKCQAGRRRKRNSRHRPLLFPFKRLLNHRSCKRKFRK